jgi:hypothetical protein
MFASVCEPLKKWLFVFAAQPLDAVNKKEKGNSV